MRLQRNESGKFDAYAWPGGYPLYYLMQDGGCLCPDCANGGNGSIASEDSEDPQWRIVGAGIHYEGEPIICDHCNKAIESAYGNPESEE